MLSGAVPLLWALNLTTKRGAVLCPLELIVMPIFRKRPVEVEARQYLNNGSSYELLHWINKGQFKLGEDVPLAHWTNGVLTIPTLEGDHVASTGDWIIRGVHGEHYPCKPEIFEKTYELVEA